MTAHGSVGPYDCQTEEWSSYCERVEHYLSANAIDKADNIEQSYCQYVAHQRSN